MDITKRLNSKTLSLKEKWVCTLKHIWENEFIWLKVNTTVPKFGSTRLKSFLRSIPRIRSLPGGDTFPSGLLYKPLFILLPPARPRLTKSRFTSKVSRIKHNIVAFQNVANHTHTLFVRKLLFLCLCVAPPEMRKTCI